VIEQTDQFQKFGKTLAQKYEFKKKIKKSDLNPKNLIFFIFLNHGFFPALEFVIHLPAVPLIVDTQNYS